jgi:hypothetical protein
MKKLTSAVLGLSLSLAVAGISFAQTPAPATKDNGSAMTTAPAKKHSKKSHKKAANSTATPAAPATAPSSK